MLPNLKVFADKIYERPLTTTAIKNGGEARKRSTAGGGGNRRDGEGDPMPGKYLVHV